MISPTPVANPALRSFERATPPDGAGPIGPDQLWPTPMTISHDEAMRGLNPMQHVPVLGMIYRLVTGETIPAPMRVLGAGIIGGPMGAFGAGFMGIMEMLFTTPPDTSRPPAPAGMKATGSEAGVEPVTPGSLDGTTAYTTLATVRPEWMPEFRFGPGAMEPDERRRGAEAYQQAASEWQRSQFVEKGLA